MEKLEMLFLDIFVKVHKSLAYKIISAIFFITFCVILPAAFKLLKIFAKITGIVLFVYLLSL